MPSQEGLASPPAGGGGAGHEATGRRALSLHVHGGKSRLAESEAARGRPPLPTGMRQAGPRARGSSVCKFKQDQTLGPTGAAGRPGAPGLSGVDTSRSSPWGSDLSDPACSLDPASRLFLKKNAQQADSKITDANLHIISHIICMLFT